MELRWRNYDTKEIGVAFVTDEDAKVLSAMYYVHDEELDFTDDDKDGEWVEVWAPINKEN